MDSGLMPAITEENFNVLTSRSPEEIVGVMDQLFSSEACRIAVLALEGRKVLNFVDGMAYRKFTISDSAYLSLY